MCHRNTTEEYVYHYEQEGERFTAREETPDDEEEPLAEADD